MDALRQLYFHRKLIFQMAKRDFQGTYLGSVLGATWLVLEPLFYVVIMWFFFTQALKVKPSGDIPYVPWLLSTMCLWSYFGVVFGASSSIFKAHSFLLRKPGFSLAIVPAIKILSALYLHAIYLAIVLVVLLASGIQPSVFWLQIVYYWACLAILLFGLTLFTGSIGVFARDVQSATALIMQFGFWVSPVFWDIQSYPEKFQWIMKVNPLYYPLSGYRQSLIHKIGFWERGPETLYFWCATAFIWLIGIWVFRRLRPQFGDML